MQSRHTNLPRWKLGACVGEVLPTTEICDGRDNDCDGTTDENLNRGLCPLQMGVCAGTMAYCVGGAFQCDYGSDYEPIEVSCDGIDNDCNGLTDEMCMDKPHVDAYGCDADTCTIVSCDQGWADCNGAFEDGCEDFLDGNTGCGSGTLLGTICGDQPGASVGSSDIGHKWSRIQVQEWDASILSTSHFNVRFALTVPAGMDCDLRVYYNCGQVGSSSAPPGVTEVVYVTWNDNLIGDDSRMLQIEVEYVSGNSCDPWNLQVIGLGQ